MDQRHTQSSPEVWTSARLGFGPALAMAPESKSSLDVLTALVDARLPINAISKALGANVTVVREARKRVYDDAFHETIWGSQMKESKIAYNGLEMEVTHLDFRSIFLYLSEVCADFGNFILKHCGQSCNIVLYMDKTTPGNVCRPDPGRSFHGVYFTIMELPEWFRTRVHAWWTLCYVSHKAMKTIGCNESVVLNWVFEKLYIESEIHKIGLYYLAGGVRRHILINHGCYLADDLSIFELGCLKGASGKAPCFCLGIRGRVDPAELVGDVYFSHFREPDASKFRHCDPETFKLKCQTIESNFQNGFISRGKQLETDYG